MSSSDATTYARDGFASSSSSSAPFLPFFLPPFLAGTAFLPKSPNMETSSAFLRSLLPSRRAIGMESSSMSPPASVEPARAPFPRWNGSAAEPEVVARALREAASASALALAFLPPFLPPAFSSAERDVGERRVSQCERVRSMRTTGAAALRKKRRDEPSAPPQSSWSRFLFLRARSASHSSSSSSPPPTS